MEEGAEMQEWPPKLCYREVPLAAEGRPRNCVPEIAFAERLSTEQDSDEKKKSTFTEGSSSKQGSQGQRQINDNGIGRENGDNRTADHL